MKIAYTGGMIAVRRLLILLLLLTYTGQSLAAVGAPCFTMGSAAGESSAAMTGMDHSAHNMALAPDNTLDSTGSSCCEGGGFCTMSQCQSVAAVPETTGLNTANYLAIYHDVSSFVSFSFSSDSLYRPPISH